MRRPSRYNIDRRAYSPSAELTHRTTTHVAAEARIRPLRDVLIVEPLEHTMSAILAVVHEEKPLRGIVKAVGPGCYLKQYATGHPPTWRSPHQSVPKHERTAVRDTKIFRPTVVRVGEEVELGGADIGGYAFDSFYWGERLHLICREEDVCGVRVPERLDEGSAAQCA